jgi:hypothetical protein
LGTLERFVLIPIGNEAQVAQVGQLAISTAEEVGTGREISTLQFTLMFTL